MKREEVFDVISQERDYQEMMSADPARPDMIEDFRISDVLNAIQFNLDVARKVWYRDSHPYQHTMEYIRKISALSVQAGEKYGIPGRENGSV